MQIFCRIFLSLLLFSGFGQHAYAGLLDDIVKVIKPRIPGSTVPGTNIPIPPLLRPPSPPTTLDGVNPLCQAMIATHRPGLATSPICGTSGLEGLIPQYVHYGDKRVNIRNQCEWHDNCYIARWHGGTFTKPQCDNVFREKLRAECRRTVARCSNVLNHCYQTVETYFAVVRDYGDTAWNSRDQDSRPIDPTVFGSQSSNTADPLESAKQNGPWVYLGSFDGEWINQIFELQNDLPNHISVGDKIRAKVDVNVRESHMYYDSADKKWKRPPRKRTMKTNEIAILIDLVAIGRASGGYYYWAQILE